MPLVLPPRRSIQPRSHADENTSDVRSAIHRPGRAETGLDSRRDERHARVISCAAGWSSSVARRAHNPEVVGSNPAPATDVMSQDIVDTRTHV